MMRIGGLVAGFTAGLFGGIRSAARKMDFNVDEADPSGEAFERHLFTFLNHCGYHFWPLFCLCGIAGYSGVGPGNIFRLALFAGSTIAVEICFGCVTHLSEHIALFGQLLGSQYAAEDDDRKFLRERQKKALVARDRYWYISCFTGMLWFVTATVDVEHLAGHHVGDWYAGAAYLAAVINVTLALKKLWYRVGHDSKATLQLVSHFANQRQPVGSGIMAQSLSE